MKIDFENPKITVINYSDNSSTEMLWNEFIKNNPVNLNKDQLQEASLLSHGLERICIYNEENPRKRVCYLERIIPTKEIKDLLQGLIFYTLTEHKSQQEWHNLLFNCHIRKTCKDRIFLYKGGCNYMVILKGTHAGLVINMIDHRTTTYEKININEYMKDLEEKTMWFNINLQVGLDEFIKNNPKIVSK